MSMFMTSPTGQHHSRYGSIASWQPIEANPSARITLPGFNSLVQGQANNSAGNYTFDPQAPTFSHQMPGPPLDFSHDSPEPSEPPSPHLRTITNKPKAKPVSKIAGSRRADKGKKRASSPEPKASRKRKASATGAPTTAKKFKGRTVGASNYTSVEIHALLDCIEEQLPIGNRAWNTTGDDYNSWAEENEMPARTAKSLEAKFKQLVKTKKPTGSGEVPDTVTRAWAIDSLMNEKAGTRDLDDSDIADNLSSVDGSDTDSDMPKIIKKPTTVKPEPGSNPVVSRLPSDRLTQPRNTRTRASEALLNNLSNTLDPAAQAARADDRSLRTIQATQIMTLTSQLRDANNTVEGLRGQLTEAERRCAAAERRADRLENKVEMLNLMGQNNRQASAIERYGHRTPPNHLRRYDIYHGDGRYSGTTTLSSDDLDPFATLNVSPTAIVIPNLNGEARSPQSFASSSRVQVEDLSAK